jgi:hypothetical protein
MGIDTIFNAAAGTDADESLHLWPPGRVLAGFLVLLLHALLIRFGVALTLIVLATEVYVWWEYRRAYGA